MGRIDRLIAAAFTAMIAALSGLSNRGDRMQERVLDHLEVEWQFDADDLDAVEDWLGGDRSGLTVSPASTKQLKDTYYDTEDWRFYRAGYALRVRRDGKKVEATMKALAPAEDGVRRRREVSEPLRSGGMKTLRSARGPVGERLRSLAGDGELRPLFENRTRRRIFELRPEGDAEGSCGEYPDTRRITTAAGRDLRPASCELSRSSSLYPSSPRRSHGTSRPRP
jgi:hypothetical protein